MTAESTATELDDRYDVAIVGGGPAGASAALFTARYGLDTVVFDSGPSSLQRCAFLANYLGFPGGVDVETFHDLAHAQVREAGATLREDRVEWVERRGSSESVVGVGSSEQGAEPGDMDDPSPSGGDSSPFEHDPFVLELHDGTRLLAESVIAATRSGGDYLRPLDGDAMFETHDHDGETHEHFDAEYADDDGRTPIDGLYVASPAGERDVQAIVAAGQGAHVARRLLADRRLARGYPDGLDEVYDWLRPQSEFAGDRGTRDRWRDWFESRVPESADLGGDESSDDEELLTLREEYVDQALATRRSPEAIESLTDASVERLVDVLGPGRVLDAIGDERLRDHLDAADDRARNAEVQSDG